MIKEYILLAYKENNVDSVRGCVMDRYDSDFKWIRTISKEELIQFWLDIRNIKLDAYECGYEYALIICDGTDFDPYEEEQEIKQAVEGQIFEQVQKAKIKRQEQEERERKEKLRQEKQTEIKRIEKEKELLKELKRKYE